MEWLNTYSGLFSLIAAIAAIAAIIVSIWLAKQNTKQINDIYKDLDKKRKYSKDYDPFLEFQDKAWGDN